MSTDELIESLSPIERKITPYLKEGNLKVIIEKSGLDETSALRALQFLENKGIIITKTQEKKVVDLGTNGVLYLKNGLPERKLLNIIGEKQNLTLETAQKESKLSDNEFKAALGALKKKAMVEMKEKRIFLASSMEEVIKKSLEEKLIEALPIDLEKLKPEQQHALKSLENRKDIIRIENKKQITFQVTPLGENLLKIDLSKTDKLIESLTPEMIKSSSWKGKKFRRYDIKSKVPTIYGGKRHFVNLAIDHGRKIWTEMGFKEMSGSLVQTSFWNFDALFTAQDHPVREMHDTFYIKDLKTKLPDKKILKTVSQAHETGVSGSKGWQYSWKEDEAKKPVLRTHTTCLSAATLASLRDIKDKKGKYFSIGKCFRNETVDWSHAFEFNQTDGIVIDPNANLRHLLGYLKEFFKKMGFEKVRFTPAYFPYTEPSVEINWFHPEKKVWLELGGSGIFRPEVVIPLLGEYIPVLAWGPGFDRALMDYYKIQDIRELYKNDINQLRKIKHWIKT
ncbi:MAG: phenylalanine--tRNA ligase subunit alpha [archaeon]